MISPPLDVHISLILMFCGKASLKTFTHHRQYSWSWHPQEEGHGLPWQPTPWHWWKCEDFYSQPSIFWFHLAWFQRNAIIIVLKFLLHDLYNRHATFLFSAFWTSSSLCHFLLAKLTFLTWFPLLPIWVPICRYPFLWVNIAGILSPMAQQLLSVEVRRTSSAIPLLRLLPAKEWMYKSKVSLKVGPQVGSVANRFLFPTGDPPTNTTFDLCVCER